MWHLRCWFRDNQNKFRFSKFTSCPLLPTWKNFLAAQVTALLFSPHLKSFPILYSSYVICLFCTSCMYLIFFLWPCFLLITFICFFLFFQSESFILQPFLFLFSVSRCCYSLSRIFFNVFFFILFLHPHQTTMSPPPLARTQYPFKSHRNLPSRWAPEGNIKRVMSGL